MCPIRVGDGDQLPTIRIGGNELDPAEFLDQPEVTCGLPGDRHPREFLNHATLDERADFLFDHGEEYIVGRASWTAALRREVSSVAALVSHVEDVEFGPARVDFVESC